MAIKAKVTIYDDETGKVYEEDRLLIPYNVEEILFGEIYEFEFKYLYQEDYLTISRYIDKRIKEGNYNPYKEMWRRDGNIQ